MIGDPADAAPAPPPPPPAYEAPPAAAPPRRSRAGWILAGLAFALGLVAMYLAWPLVERWRAPPATVPQTDTTAAPASGPAVAAPAVTAPVTLDALAGREAILDSRLRAIETRMAAADAGSRTAAAYARRAEGLLIAFAARRALDRGLTLGYVEGQLRDRFGAEEGNAVAIVIAASRAPVTREELRLALDQIAPRLSSGSADEGFFAAAGREVSNLVVLRRETTPSPRPSDRLTRARRMIDAGNVEGALAEVARMPGAAAATSWIDAAKRYINARRAVARLEIAAIGSATPLPAAPAPAPLNPAGRLPGA